MNYIYTLSDPITGIVRYVGKATNPLKRFGRHLSKSNLLKKRHSALWIKSLIDNGQKPVLSIIETIPKDENWSERECYWIAFYKKMGNDLTNLTDGGEGGITLGRLGKKNSVEHIRKSSEGRKKRNEPDNVTPQGRINRAEGLRKFWKNNIRKVYQYDLNGVYIQEWESAIVAGKAIGINYSTINTACKNSGRTAKNFLWRYEKHSNIPPYIKKSPPNKGIKLSKEMKLKISKSKQGKPWTEARRAAQERRSHVE